MELVDCHTHTFYSDGTATVLQNVRRAAELGVSTICCTDHLTMPYEMDPNCDVSVAERDLDAYGRDVIEARTLCPEIDVVYGFECDYYEGCESYIAKWRGPATFLLGSVHGIDGRWIDYLKDLSYWDEMGTDYIWRRYFEVWCEACASPVRFDSMAHPDLLSLIDRYPSFDLAPLYKSAATTARDCGVRVEINTAGVLKPVGRFYPAPALLEEFCKAGVPLTVGSDAHAVERIAQNIDKAYALAHSVGYRKVEVPTSDGGWRSIAL